MRRLILLLLLVFSTAYVHASPKSIYIVLSSGDEVYYKIGNALSEQFSHSEFPIDHIKVITLNEEQFDTIKEDDLIVAIGNKAAEESYRYRFSNTIIYSFVEQNKISEIYQGNEFKDWAAITVNQPVERLISIADNLVKNKYKNKIVIVISQNNVQLKRAINAIKPLKKGQIEIVEIQPDDVVAKVVEKSLFNAAALISTDEENIWSGTNAKGLLRQAYNYQVPIVGNSKRFLKAGALISVYSSMEKISEATLQLMQQWFDDQMLTSTGIHYVPSTIDINKNIAQVLHYNMNVLQTLEVGE